MIIHAIDDGYTVIDYNYTLPDSFDDPIRRECRGIKFSPCGKILARPLHKFFNVNERPETQESVIDWGRPHVVTEKLDGSMIHPILVNGQVRFCTRMGITDVAQACEGNRATEAVAGWCSDLLRTNVTPIFEWVSPQNRIVLNYMDDRLVLLALRDNISGQYLRGVRAETTGRDRGLFDCPNVLASDAYGDWRGLARHIEGLTEQEGYVVWFVDGKEPQAVKVKAPWYVTRHRALDGLRFEHHVVRLILDNGVDDVLPMLPEQDRAKLQSFTTCLRARVTEKAAYLAGTLIPLRGRERKHFATVTMPLVDPFWRPAAFRIYDGADPFDVVDEAVRNATRNRTDCDRAMTALGMDRRWT